VVQNERKTTTRGNPQDAAEKGRQRDIGAVAGGLGTAIREERRRRRLTIAQVATAAGLSFSAVQAVESGRVASLDTYVRLARALRLQPSFEFLDPRRREASPRREDPVHAAMGEAEAARLQSLGYEVRMDEPFQHYQFAGRGDVVAWSVERASMMHIENRTEFPNIQAAFGAFNAKREYLGAELAARVGVRRWGGESHVMAAIWSADVIHTVRRHRASFDSLGPEGPAIFDNWWNGQPSAGKSTGFVLFDPVEGGRCDARRWAGITDLAVIRARHRSYRDALHALSAAGQA
jgi:transcriptional regulator with XRE-family HTH domain